MHKFSDLFKSNITRLSRKLSQSSRIPFDKELPFCVIIERSRIVFIVVSWRYDAKYIRLTHRRMLYITRKVLLF